MFSSFFIGSLFANNLVAYSQDYAKNSLYLKFFQKKTRCIYPPVVFPKPVDKDIKMLRKKINKKRKILIGYAGRLVEEKGVDILFKALEYLANESFDFLAIFAGEKEVHYENRFNQWKPMIEALGDQVLFLGLLKSDKKLANFYSLCDVLVLPSRRECFGLVQVEAMLSGTPVIASDIFGGRVPVKMTGMGLLFESENYIDLANSIKLVIEKNRNFIKSRKYIQSVFNIEETVQNYENLFKS
jgi:glycosyltransferase involved in cell wall biosynthesis